LRGSSGRAAIAVVALTTAIVAAVDPPQLIKPSQFTEHAPDTFGASFETNKGTFVVEVHRDWAPLGADRFFNLVKGGFYDDCRFFRVIDSLLVQVGIHPNPKVQAAWAAATIPDDPRKESNKRGTVTFASGGPNTRSTQFFINLADNNRAFDRQRLAPIGRVVSGLEVVDSLYSGYGEGAPRGSGPDQSTARAEGNAYLTKNFPKLDYIRKATIQK
jgi:peptidyl-prolyl cis-trans isomerase A (cyclophilin A)